MIDTSNKSAKWLCEFNLLATNICYETLDKQLERFPYRLSPSTLRMIIDECEQEAARILDSDKGQEVADAALNQALHEIGKLKVDRASLLHDDKKP